MQNYIYNLDPIFLENVAAILPWGESDGRSSCNHEKHIIITAHICKYHLFYTHTHMHARTQMQILLLPLGGHAHLAEPGCLCTKQALWAVQAKLLEPS